MVQALKLYESVIAHHHSPKISVRSSVHIGKEGNSDKCTVLKFSEIPHLQYHTPKFPEKSDLWHTREILKSRLDGMEWKSLYLQPTTSLIFIWWVLKVLAVIKFSV